ncbi:MAG: hypothetical protein IJV85_03635 [Clostridia bacterium]|nr:hypothetical protein [Clostridia bacterium]
MAIGKNAIKRVENNGYSKVKTTAPDMDNSVVEEVKEAKAEVVAPKKTTAKKPAAKKPATKKVAKPCNSIKKIAIGQELPFYLL